MKLEEVARMEDTYRDIEEILEKIGNLTIFPRIVWVWTWNVVKDMYEDFKDGGDPFYCVSEDIETVWTMFWEDADKNGFTLEYGPDALSEQVRDWLIDSGIVIETVEEDDDE